MDWTTRSARDLDRSTIMALTRVTGDAFVADLESFYASVYIGIDKDGKIKEVFGDAPVAIVVE
eukprot:scaffold94500_cov63-Attheya_sp.AAC.2